MTIKKKKLMNQLDKMGILTDDPRVSKLIETLETTEDDSISLTQLTIGLNYKGIKSNPHIEFLVRVFTSDLLISEFCTFKETVKDLYAQCKNNFHGNPADYIPELAKGPRANWGVSICTVEGQRL
jgi:hypothetical protein